MKIFVKKNTGAEHRKYKMEMPNDALVYDLMEKCREKWKGSGRINEDTALFCSDEAGAEYDTDVKLSELEGKVLIVRQNQEELTAEESERLLSGYYDYLILTKKSAAFSKYKEIDTDGALCVEVANYSAVSLTSHKCGGKTVDKQRDVMPRDVEGLLVTDEMCAVGSVSWLLGHGKMLVVTYTSAGYLCLTVCGQCDNSDWVTKGREKGDQPKCDPWDGTLPNIGHSVWSGRVDKKSEASLCLQGDEHYIVTARVKMGDRQKMYAEVRLYPRQLELWEEVLRKKMIQ